MTETAAPPVEGTIVNPPAEQVQYEDYWSPETTTRWYLPDGKQYFEIMPMNEGKKSMFQKKTSRDIVLNRTNDDAKISVDPAGDRHQLIKESVVDWFLMQKTPGTGVNGVPAEFTPMPWAPKNLDTWISKAPPHIVEKLEHAIRMVNPWLQADMTVEAIDEEIERLYELRKQRVAEQQGEGASANK